MTMEHMREPEKSPAPSVIAANARAAPGGGLEWVLDAVVDESCKAWPPQLGPRRVRDIGGLGLNLYRGDLPAPVAVLREEAIQANEEWMRLFLASTKTLLCPHGKTTMAPQLFARQIAHGAWGITMATRHQVGIARRAGVRKIILANEPVAMSDMQWIAAEVERAPDLETLHLCRQRRAGRGVVRSAAPASRTADRPSARSRLYGRPDRRAHGKRCSRGGRGGACGA